MLFLPAACDFTPSPSKCGPLSTFADAIWRNPLSPPDPGEITRHGGFEVQNGSRLIPPNRLVTETFPPRLTASGAKRLIRPN
jgi:hypothetical protein